MSNRNLGGLKPQDILVLLKLIVAAEIPQKTIALALEISPGEISHGIQRLKSSRLLTDEGKVNIEASQEFLVHGLKYMIPPQIGPMTVGIPTSFAHPKFKFVRYYETKDEIYVWPYSGGSTRGSALIPIYPTVAKACADDPKLYYLAALVEMLRAGRAREQKIATEELKKYTGRFFEE